MSASINEDAAKAVSNQTGQVGSHVPRDQPQTTHGVSNDPSPNPVPRPPSPLRTPWFDGLPANEQLDLLYDLIFTRLSLDSKEYITQLISAIPDEQHQVGRPTGNETVPESHIQTMPAGTAPAESTFQPNTGAGSVPGQADNPYVDPEGMTSASDTLGGATSKDMHQGLGEEILDSVLSPNPPPQGDEGVEKSGQVEMKQEYEWDGVMTLERVRSIMSQLFIDQGDSFPPGSVHEEESDEESDEESEDEKDHDGDEEDEEDEDSEEDDSESDDSSMDSGVPSVFSNTSIPSLTSSATRVSVSSLSTLGSDESSESEWSDNTADTSLSGVDHDDMHPETMARFLAEEGIEAIDWEPGAN